jgi:hypothetical protein
MALIYKFKVTARALCTLFLLGMVGLSAAFGQEHNIDVTKMVNHPRLLLLQGQEDSIKKKIAQEPLWQNVHNSIIEQCDAMLLLYPIERKLIGRRLLSQSREGLRRIFYLSYAWRITAKKKYFKRCEEEMLAIAGFTDWNPDHFLDVAEMTTAVAIGYDWLYNDLSPKSRKIISDAIIQKGINPSLNSKYNGWLRGTNNWNQVCNGGITFGALAVYEDQPQVSIQLINRALNSILLPMEGYAPDGNYTEGYSYWGYGTSFNVFFISAIETLFKTDYGLSQQPGFLKTATFYENLIGPSGLCFNYSDCGGLEALQPAMFWFANKTNDNTLLYNEKANLTRGNFYAKGNRFLPAALLWGHNIPMQKITAPKNKIWAGHGENPVAIMRTSWGNANAISAGFKGGTPSASHGHMDAGSFVMDAEGVRWSADLGMQEYESLESKGLNIWDMKQTSQRWEVFRYSNLSHSTLTVNNHLQSVKGTAPMLKYSGDSTFTRAVMDLTAIYQEDLSKAQRGIAIVNGQYVNIRDEIETGDKECTVRWAMLTPATIAGINGNQAQLSSKGKKLTFYVDGVPGATIRTWSTDPQHSYDALNIGTTLVGFEFTVPPHTKKTINVFLLPGEKSIAVQKTTLKPLPEW